mmetsp:Transcript_31488/g.93903  ORF Transcript_31488/g.93903 Transcript_31488/m.93903 type:complete len:224 (+) Transcript_31488:1381-2052(+)
MAPLLWNPTFTGASTSGVDLCHRLSLKIGWVVSFGSSAVSDWLPDRSLQAVCKSEQLLSGFALYLNFVVNRLWYAFGVWRRCHTFGVWRRYHTFGCFRSIWLATRLDLTLGIFPFIEHCLAHTRLRRYAWFVGHVPVPEMLNLNWMDGWWYALACGVRGADGWWLILRLIQCAEQMLVLCRATPHTHGFGQDRQETPKMSVGRAQDEWPLMLVPCRATSCRQT